MKILRVKGTNMFDVFHGEGWGNHTRVRRQWHRGHFFRVTYHHVSGIYMNFQQIREALKPFHGVK